MSVPYKLNMASKPSRRDYQRSPVTLMCRMRLGVQIVACKALITPSIAFHELSLIDSETQFPQPINLIKQNSNGRGTVDIGAAWINNTTQRQMHALAKRFGIDVVKQRSEGLDIQQQDDDSVYIPAFREFKVG